MYLSSAFKTHCNEQTNFCQCIAHPVVDFHLYLALALAGPPPSSAVHISESAICIRHMSFPHCPLPASTIPLPWLLTPSKPCSFCSGCVVIVWSRPLAQRKSTQLTVIAFYRLSLDKVFHRPQAFPPRPFSRTRTFLVIAAIVVAAAIVVICRFTRFLYFNLIL